jgi:uncharacterized protein
MRCSATFAKSVITAYLTSISNREFDALQGYFTDDATWWISGNPARVPKAGEKPASEQIPNLPNLLTRFDDYRYDIVNMVGEGPKVIVEAQAVGTGPADLVYVNNITSAFTVTRDGLIDSVREYPDHKEIEWLLKWFADHPDA